MIDDGIVDYMSHNSPFGIVVVGEMRTVTLSSLISVVTFVSLIGNTKVNVYLKGVNKCMDAHVAN